MMNYTLIVIAITVAVVSLFLLFILTGGKEEKTPPALNDQPTTPPKKPYIVTSHDIKAIAGGDVMTTQLDLARAYIEMGKKQLAKKILTHVMEHGDENHQNEANMLIATL